MYQYLSIGGWCGTRLALDQLKITNEPNNIFDYIRSSSKGIIDCIKNDFTSFFPENKQVDSRFKYSKYKGILGEHFGFYHNEDFTKQSVLDSFDRKIKRFIEHCNSDKKCIFIRTCVIPDYESELNDMKILYEEIHNKYPNLSFVIVFIIQEQEITTYYTNIENKIFIFCLNSKSHNNNNLGNEYKNIFTFISENDIFNTIPPSNESIKIVTPSPIYCLVDNIPAVNYFERYLLPPLITITAYEPIKKNSINTTCVCLICYKPNDIWIDFLQKFTKYDIYIIIDDNTKDYKKHYSNISNINIIQINNEECKKNGFINMNFTVNKEVTGWDKSIYYFSTINTEYNNIWFFEDDVFFYNEESLLQIDSKYDNFDLLSREFNNTYISGSKQFWHWEKININFEPPYYRCMVCCVRISSNLLCKIRNYANEHHTLFFLEALFPTLCKKYELLYDSPDEFKNILYRKDYTDKDIDTINIFHPVKNITKHKYYRDMLNKTF